MTNNIIETKLGKKVDLQRISEGSASPITKAGAFYVFSVRVSEDDIREYSFTTSNKAVHMRKIMIGHLEEKFKKELKSYK